MVARSTALALTSVLLVALFSSEAVAQTGAEIDLTVDRESAQIGEVIQVTLEIRYEGRGRITIPNFSSPDFQVVSSFDFSSSFNRSSVHTRRIGVVARREGELTLGPFAINIGGQIQYTEVVSIRIQDLPGSPTAPPRTPDPIQIQIGPRTGSSPRASAQTGPQTLAPRQQQPEANLPERVLSSQPFLTASPTSRRVYAGEQFVVDYEMFSPSRGWRLVSLDQPAFPEFWFTTVDQEMTQYQRRIVGERQHYQSSFVARFVLAALEPGTFDIPTMVAEVSRRGERIPLESAAVPVEIRDLPEGAPAGFYSSNVGQYEFTVDVQSPNERVGDPIRVVMRAEGSGLTSLLRMPELPVSGAAQLQAPVEQREQRLITEYHVGGFKQVELVVIPTEEGDLTIGPVSFHYFDPDRGEYQTATSDTWAFSIVGTSPTADLVLAQQSDDDLQSRLLSALSEPRDSTSEHRAISIPRPLFWTLSIFPPLVFFSAGAIGRIRRRRSATASARARRSALYRARRSLRGAEKGDDPFGSIAAAVRVYLRERLGFAAAALTLEDTTRALTNGGATFELAEQVSQVLEACENAKYSTMSDKGDAAELASKALRVLTELEQLK